MISLIGSWISAYQYYVAHDKFADPRTKDWLLLSSPLTLLTILASYLYFCTKAGPRFMEGRKPYELKNTLIVYNFLQIILSCYMFYEVSKDYYLGIRSSIITFMFETVLVSRINIKISFLSYGIFAVIVNEGTAVWMKYDLVCEPLDFSTRPNTMRMLSVAWVYLIAKVTELLDTIFFVLRKKYNQVTFLHLFHHTVMPTFSCMGLRYGAGSGLGTLFGVINSFVHIIMYSYYLVAGLGPEYQKYLWWKKHLTSLQLIQFSIVFIQNFTALFSDCLYPKSINLLLISFSVTFLYMFGNFYINSYVQKPKAKKVNKEH